MSEAENKMQDLVDKLRPDNIAVRSGLEPCEKCGVRSTTDASFATNMVFARAIHVRLCIECINSMDDAFNQTELYREWRRARASMECAIRGGDIGLALHTEEGFLATELRVRDWCKAWMAD